MFVNTVNGQPKPLEGDQVKHLKRELQSIRNQVNSLLDNLEPPQAQPVEVTSVENVSSSQEQKAEGPQVGMFDPIKPQEDASVMSSFGVNANEGNSGFISVHYLLLRVCLHRKLEIQICMVNLT